MKTRDEQQFALSLTLQDGYAFTVDFDGGEPPLLVDERPPLGQGRGPNPARLLAAAVGSCLGASLLFCLRKARAEVAGLRTTVEGTIVRNDRGRLRIGALRVRLVPDASIPARCLELFEDFCIVTQSVRQGIEIDVQIAQVPVPSAEGA